MDDEKLFEDLKRIVCEMEELKKDQPRFVRVTITKDHFLWDTLLPYAKEESE